MSTGPSIPGSRWRRSGPARAEARGAADRVRLAQAQARQALVLALAFAAAAALAAALGLGDTGRWLPVHLFFGGAVVLSISGASVLFTVTWSAGPAPPAGRLALQRGLVALGIVLVAVGREAELGDGAVVAGATAFAAGLVLLGYLLAVTVVRGPERRYDVAVAWYLAALVAGLAAAPMGAAMATGTGAGLRASHLALNLFGLVGLVVGGTLPTFAATAARSRMAPHATPGRHASVLAWQGLALIVAVVALADDAAAAAAAGLGAYALGVAAVALLLPRPDAKKRAWAGPRLLGLWAGIAWWASSVVAAAADAAAGRAVLAGPWLVALTVAGYGQILWAAFAYLGPVLRGGGHERLTEGFATTRSWVGLAAANGAGLAAVLDLGTVVAGAVGVWLADAAWRAARLRRPRAVSAG